MPRYNTSFDLDVQDLELIEDALRARKSDLSLERLALLGGDGGAPDPEALAALDATISATHVLLGRLHNQKVFYRPETVQNAPYISG
ncbi:hypothetical protein [Aestuariivita sp.]|jgi:hypothetical protein|uniref:hypothetical protein n=1 Tax=Aestuariivita sp. TaxID=1872407 RepID=UPI00216E5893|nr:hypothetical protein [Aestuariivita sp.]MCE8007838.1 hypothetical protein [Aestuariivita sp.]